MKLKGKPVDSHSLLGGFVRVVNTTKGKRKTVVKQSVNNPKAGPTTISHTELQVINSINNMFNNVLDAPDGCYTYILLCADGTHYTGITKDIKKRLLQHKAGQSKSTQYLLPVALIYLTYNTTRKKARLLEVKIKNRGATRYMESRRGKH